jgi:hypothetical protein
MSPDRGALNYLNVSLPEARLSIPPSIFLYPYVPALVSLHVFLFIEKLYRITCALDFNFVPTRFL